MAVEENKTPGENEKNPPLEEGVTDKEILDLYKDHDKKFVKRDVFEKLQREHNETLKDIMEGKFSSSNSDEENEQENNEPVNDFKKMTMEELNKISYDAGAKTKNVDFWRAQLAAREKMITEKGIDPFLTAGFDKDGNALMPVAGEKEAVEDACKLIESFIEASYDEVTKTYNNQVFDTLFTKRYKA